MDRNKFDLICASCCVTEGEYFMDCFCLFCLSCYRKLGIRVLEMRANQRHGKTQLCFQCKGKTLFQSKSLSNFPEGQKLYFVAKSYVENGRNEYERKLSVIKLEALRKELNKVEDLEYELEHFKMKSLFLTDIVKDLVAFSGALLDDLNPSLYFRDKFGLLESLFQSRKAFECPKANFYSEVKQNNKSQKLGETIKKEKENTGEHHLLGFLPATNKDCDDSYAECFGKEQEKIAAPVFMRSAKKYYLQKEKERTRSVPLISSPKRLMDLLPIKTPIQEIEDFERDSKIEINDQNYTKNFELEFDEKISSIDYRKHQLISRTSSNPILNNTNRSFLRESKLMKHNKELLTSGLKCKTINSKF